MLILVLMTLNSVLSSFGTVQFGPHGRMVPKMKGEA